MGAKTENKKGSRLLDCIYIFLYKVAAHIFTGI